MEIIFVDFAYPLFLLGIPLVYAHRDGFKGITLASGVFFGFMWLLFILFNTHFYLNVCLPLLVEVSTTAVICAGVDVISWIVLSALPSSMSWIFFSYIEIMIWSIGNWEFVACLPFGIFFSVYIFGFRPSFVQRSERDVIKISKSSFAMLHRLYSICKVWIENTCEIAMEIARSPVSLPLDWRYEDAEVQPASPAKSWDTPSSSPPPVQVEQEMDVDEMDIDEIEVDIPEMQQMEPSPSPEQEKDTGLQSSNEELEIPEMQQMALEMSTPPPEQQPSPPPPPSPPQQQQQAPVPVETPMPAALPIEAPRRRARFAENPVTRVRIIEPAPFWPRLEPRRRRAEEVRLARQTAAAPQEPSQDHAAVITTSVGVEQTAVEIPAQDSQESHVPEATTNIEAGYGFDNITSAPPPVETAVGYPILNDVSSTVPDPITRSEAVHSFESIVEASPSVETAIETSAQDAHFSTVAEATTTNEAGHSFANLFPAPPAVENTSVSAVLGHMPTDYNHMSTYEEPLASEMDLDDTPANPEPMDEGNDSSNVGSTSVNDADMEMDATNEETPSVPLPMLPAAPVQPTVAGPDISMAEEASISLSPVSQSAPPVQQLPLPLFTGLQLSPGVQQSSHGPFVPQPSPAVPQPSPPVPQFSLPSFTAPQPAPQRANLPPPPVRAPVPVLRTTPGRLALPWGAQAGQQPLRREAVAPPVPPRPDTEMSEEELMRAMGKGKKKVTIDRGLIPISQESSREADTPMAPPSGRVAQRPTLFSPAPVSHASPFASQARPALAQTRPASSQAEPSASPTRRILQARGPPRPARPITPPTPSPMFPAEPPTPGLDPLPELDDEEKCELEIALEIDWVTEDHGIPDDREHDPLREQLYRRKAQRDALPESERELRALLLREEKRLKRLLGVKKVPLHLRKR